MKTKEYLYLFEYDVDPDLFFVVTFNDRPKKEHENEPLQAIIKKENGEEFYTFKNYTVYYIGEV